MIPLAWIAVGMGLGYLNATALGIPAWANIVAMVVIASFGRVYDE